MEESRGGDDGAQHPAAEDGGSAQNHYPQRQQQQQQQQQQYHQPHRQIPSFQPQQAGGPRMSHFQIPEFRPAGHSSFNFHAHQRQSSPGVMSGDGLDTGAMLGTSHFAAQNIALAHALQQQQQQQQQQPQQHSSMPMGAGQYMPRSGFPARPSHSWTPPPFQSQHQPAPQQLYHTRPPGPARPGNHTVSHATAAAAAVPAPSVPLLSRLPPLPPMPNELLAEGKADDDKERARRRAYQAREEALMLRIEAIGFQPAKAWSVMKEVVEGPGKTQAEEDGVDKEKEKRAEDREAEVKDHAKAETAEKEEGRDAAPILGIRLLQRLHALEEENQELGRIVADLAGKKQAKGDESQVQVELQDAHELIAAMDSAMKGLEKRAEEAEARANASERALAVACARNSSSILDERRGGGLPTSPTTSPSSRDANAGAQSASTSPASPPPKRWNSSSRGGHQSGHRGGGGGGPRRGHH